MDQNNESERRRSIMDWIRLESKPVKSATVVWFLLIGKWNSWKIGKVEKLRLGEDLWRSCSGNFILSTLLLKGLLQQN